MSSVAARPTAPVRLTRRGRVVVVLALVALVLLAVALLGRAPSEAAPSSRGPATRAVVVQPGQTLWQIAREVAPTRDPRETVERLRELNDLGDLGAGALRAGQRLVVPA